MRSRISRGSGFHDRRPVRGAVAAGGAGLSPPARDAARGTMGSHRGGARGGESSTLPAVAASTDQGSTLAYRVAAAQYLTRTEALLTGFRAEARSPSVPAAQFATQARDLLATTRLMLDSPAAKDARLKSLLEDLELVLAQIAQLPSGGSGDREDVQSINQGL